MLVLTKEKLIEILKDWSAEKANFSEVLKAVMQCIGLSKEQLAEKMYVKPSLLEEWIGGKNLPLKNFQEAYVKLLISKITKENCSDCQ